MARAAGTRRHRGPGAATDHRRHQGRGARHHPARRRLHERVARSGVGCAGGGMLRSGVCARASICQRMKTRSFRYGYNTNGFAHHRLDDALRVIAELGYEGCALTLDHAHLDPFDPDIRVEVERIAALAHALRLSLVVETGARFLLDPRRKHEPTLLSDEVEGRARRREFLERALAIARDLGAGGVSPWGGARPPRPSPPGGWGRPPEQVGGGGLPAPAGGDRVRVPAPA